MKEELTKLITEKYPSFKNEEEKTKTFLNVYKILSEAFDRDFDMAWQIVIKSKRNVA